MRDFNKIEEYRKLLIGQTVKSVEFAKNADEGLEINFKNGTSLCIRFSGCEGDIKIEH